MSTRMIEPSHGLEVAPLLPGDAVIHALREVVGPEGITLLSGRDDGLWRFARSAGRWERVGTDLPRPPAMTCLAVAPDQPTTVFAGGPNTLLRSGDGGVSWRSLPLPAPAPFITALAVSPRYAEDGTLFLATLEDGVLRSDDRGEHWRRWNFGLLDFCVLALACSPSFATDDTLYAGTETALARSENGGRAWRETPFPDVAPPVLSLAPGTGGEVWAGTEQGELWSSRDAGATWHQQQVPGEPAPINQLLRVDGMLVVVQPGAIHVRDGAVWQRVAVPQAPGTLIAAVTASAPRRDAVVVQFQDGRVVTAWLDNDRRQGKGIA